ncbi:MAG: FISUMP domain-containing protein [Sphingobacteriales bacterium]
MKIKNLLWIFMAITAITTGCKKEKKAAFATLSTTAATGISATSAQTGGNISNNGGTAISSSGVCWATHSGPTVADSLRYSTSGSTGAFTNALTGLNANTIYYVRAFAINGTGTAYGNEVTFTTAKGMATVTTTTVSGIDPVAATGTGGGNITNDGGAAITARGIVWSKTVHPTLANNPTSDNSGAGSFTSTFSLLLSTTTYYYRAYATNSFGTAYGNELSFTTSSINTVQDIDGNVYHTITIGTQTWTTSNLKVTHYRNGDPITNGLTGFDWQGGNALTGAYSFPNGDSTLNRLYGKLYNMAAVRDARKIAPAGWHIPTDAEWQVLELYEGMAASDTSIVGTRGTIAPKLKEGGSSGLNLQLPGYLFTGGPGYYSFNVGGYYWSSTFATVTGNYYRTVYVTGNGNDPGVKRTYANYAISVRCIKD